MSVWRPLTPLVVFVAFFHAAVAAVLFVKGFPLRYLPIGEQEAAAIMFVVCVVVGPLLALFIRIIRDLAETAKGGRPPPPGKRLKDMFPLFGHSALFAFIYLIALIAYVNLKPAIPLINTQLYDGPLESFERALFGGILPTRWLLTSSPPLLLAFWDNVYRLLALFMFVSLTVALYYDGMVGGARLVLAYCIGLFIDLFFTLWIPSFGPIFVHPGWFEPLANLHTGELARFLQLTVRQYAESPGTVYACAGISALPSYHVYAWVCGFVYWRRLPRSVFIAGFFLTALNWISTVVLGWHYAVDGLAGIVLALLVTWIVARIIPASATVRPERASLDIDQRDGGRKAGIQRRVP